MTDALPTELRERADEGMESDDDALLLRMAAQRIDFLEGENERLLRLAEAWETAAVNRREQAGRLDSPWDMSRRDEVLLAEARECARVLNVCATGLRQSLQQNNDEKGV